MGADKRSVHTDALATLGTIIDETAGRDAIHLAVEPVIAGQDLKPGMDIGIRDGQAFKFMVNEKSPVKLVGIVDPFLKDTVKRGQRFWLIVYPRTITSLRHVWEHPLFPSPTPAENKSESSEKTESEKWIADFAETLGFSYKRLMEYADTWVYTDSEGGWGGEYTYDNSETYKDHYDKFPEFWRHYEIVTGKKPVHAESFFTCSC